MKLSIADWFKRSVSLEFTTPYQHLAEFHPPVIGARAIPKWVASLQKKELVCPHTNQSRLAFGANIATCPGFRELLVKSIVIPAWTDIEIVVNAELQRASWYFGDSFTRIKEHEPYQIAPAFNDKYHILKLIAPWYAKASADVSFLQCQAFWHTDKVKGDVIMPPGVMNLYQYRGELNQFLFVDKQKTQNIFIPAGTPLTYLIPMTKDRIKVKVSQKDGLGYDMMAFNKDYYKRQI